MLPRYKLSSVTESPHPIVTEQKDGRSWRIGNDADVAWITDGVTSGLSIAASVPPVFSAYATLAFPAGPEPNDRLRGAQDRFDDALVRVLATHTASQAWWLGFLDTGASDVIFPAAQRVTLYGWGYVLVQAGPSEARTWRDDRRWFTALPELMFPTDRSWLVSSLWDDAWAGVGGSNDLISELLQEPDLRASAERTDPTLPDMWPSSLPQELRERLKR